MAVRPTTSVMLPKPPESNAALAERPDTIRTLFELIVPVAGGPGGGVGPAGPPPPPPQALTITSVARTVEISVVFFTKLFPEQVTGPADASDNLTDTIGSGLQPDVLAVHHRSIASCERYTVYFLEVVWMRRQRLIIYCQKISI